LLHAVAEILIHELEENGDSKKQALYRACQEADTCFYPLKIALPALGSPSLLDRVQNRLDVEGSLRSLRRQRFKERGNSVYIPPQAKASLQAPDGSRFPLMETVKDFVASDQQVFLLLGDSGSGKSTFNRELEYELWQMYKKKTSVIPLYINLPAIDKPEHDMIAKQLRKAEFTEPQIRELKLYRKFIVICDGYDESQQTHNLYTSNRLNRTGEWQAKMVISCRSEYLGVDYRDRFQPGDRNQISSQALFQEAVMTQFSMDQVQDYIEQYVSVHQPLWGAKEYMDVLDLIPSLKELVKNPFMMSLSLEVLPRMVDAGQDLRATRITRVALYDQFIEHWLERGKKRLGEKNLSPQARAAYESLSDEGFTQSGMDFLKKLCVAMYKEQGGQPIVQYSRYKDEWSWKAAFFSREDEKQLLREACPLTRSGNQHKFIHRSLLEYGLALAVFDPQDVKDMSVSEPVLSRRGSTSSEASFVIHDTVEDTTVTCRLEPDLNSPLAWKSFVKDPSVLQFLEDRVQQEPAFKQLLLDYIEHSKADKKWRTAAANAITILVRSNTTFIGADLRGIRVPGADLSYGVFESAQLQGADLRNVNFCGVWLPNADLNKANLKGAQFGELPFLVLERVASSAIYSPDGKTFAAGLNNGKVIMYSTSNWEVLWTSSDRSDSILNLTYSPNGDLIAFGSTDTAVRLLDTETGECRYTFTGHEKDIKCIVFSPQGHLVASASLDNNVRLWEIQSEKCRYTLTGHTDVVLCVTYSPRDRQVASCGQDMTVRLWDTEAGVCSHTLSGHGSVVQRVVYSPQGDQVASISDDTTARLWDTRSGVCLHALTGHSAPITSAVYSLQGDQIATSSSDKTARLWDVQAGACRHTLAGHASGVNQVVYSPRGGLIVSVSDDDTVRLWDDETGICRQTLYGHSAKVTSVAFSPGGDQVATCSFDVSVRLWDVDVGALRHFSSGHIGRINEIVYSPAGGQAASCGKDGTVRLWDVETGDCRLTLTGDDTGDCNSIAYSPHGDLIASATNDEMVRLWNIHTGDCLHTLGGHSWQAVHVAYSPRGNQIASCSVDSVIQLWDTNTGTCIHTLNGHRSLVWSMVYSPHGDQVASISEDNTVRLWDTESGACLHVLTGHDKSIHLAVYSPQGDQIASASKDKTVRLWDVESGVCRHTLTGHSDQVNSVAYSSRDGLVASASSDCTVRLWDARTGDCLYILTDHTGSVRSVEFSPQGDHLASVSSDNTIRLWDVASGQCRAVIRGHDYIRCIAWGTHLDVNYLVDGYEDGTVGLWEVINEGDRCVVRLRWRATKGGLTVKGASIQDVQGLSLVNRKLLEQREAVGEPVNLLREASKKLIKMGSVVSKLKPSSSTTIEGSTTRANPPAEQSEQVEESRS